MVLKTAVIGLGNMGRHHVRHYAKHSNLVAVCDPDQESLDTFTKDYTCRGYTDVEDLLANEVLDAVTIAAPTFLHFEIAKKIIQKNIHVLIEKPITETPEEGAILGQLAKDHHVTLMVGHIERFNPVIIALKNLIDAGKIGQVASIITRRVSPMPTQIKDANVRIDLAVHDVDLCSYLIGKDPISVTSKSGSLILKDREDHAEFLLDYGTANALVQVNWITPIKIRTLSLTGSKGYAEVNFLTQELTFYRENQEPQLIQCAKQESLELEIKHFIAAITTRTDPLIGEKEASSALKWVISQT